MDALVGIDPESDGPARAGRLDVATTHEGVDGLIALPGYPRVGYHGRSAGAQRRWRPPRNRRRARVR